MEYIYELTMFTDDRTGYNSLQEITFHKTEEGAKAYYKKHLKDGKKISQSNEFCTWDIILPFVPAFVAIKRPLLE